ncbi:MAG: CDP-glycerol glycerophosphotransferase family protein, partial [Ruminococcus sp.]|nr:CDP-glycerol glycerophosphotransferase family protein [Ruminococcus sp.]
MGFGPICTNHEQIIDTLCRYMDNNCVMEDMYKARVDDFFEYSDYNNCERIYEKVVEFQNKFDKVNKHQYK